MTKVILPEGEEISLTDASVINFIKRSDDTLPLGWVFVRGDWKKGQLHRRLAVYNTGDKARSVAHKLVNAIAYGKSEYRMPAP